MLSKKKIVIIGANGQLGSELVKQFQHEHDVVSIVHHDLEISELESVQSVLHNIKPDIIYNTAAYHHVPKCEENPDIAFRVNSIGALNLAKTANDIDAILVHYSTDYVFDGLKRAPYLESDQPNPLNFYALTKHSGEILIQNNCHRYYIIRISGIYGNVVCRAKGGNFITTMIKAAKERDVVRVVNDEILTPTPVHEIALNTSTLLESDAYGLYHMTCESECSWFDFAQSIFAELNLTTPLEPCTVADFPSPVLRPTYSVLENQCLKNIKLNQMNHWKDAVIKFINENYN